MASQNVTASQLKRAQEAQFHRNGEPLQTTEQIREWVEAAGLLPVYPLAQFQAPAPSFAEAVLGRTENNWVPQPKRSAVTGDGDDLNESPDGSDEESYEFEAEDEEPEEDFASDDDEDEIDEDEEEQDDDEDPNGESDDEDETDLDSDDEEDEDEPATDEGDEAMLAGDGNIPADRETMLSDEDEFAEDEGDEIAEEDRIHSAGDPVPNDLHEGSTSSESAEEDEPAVEPVNGFTPEERETVNRALARLIEDGTVVPLNLLGNALGEPDYIVPASAFSFVYTLRGDKNWKNEPATTGSMRVSPLAVKVFALLKDKGAMAPHQLTGHLGQGITDSATLRALTELWAIQRVIPLPNADGAPAKWELITSKFLRHMKAGANAGQPTALSALLSLYLHQAIAATGDEMEIFLSPLAARSRVREVVHGLSATRQLEELVVDGKTLLHITGELPQMPADDAARVAAAPQRSRYEQDDRRAAIDERRARFGNRDEGRPARKPFSDRGGSRGDRPGFGDRARKPFGERRSFGDNAGDRERRPFQRREGGAEGGPGERRGFQPRERGNFAPRGDREGFQPRERSGFAGRGDREGGAPRDRNSFARPWDDERPRRTEGDGERRPFTPREGGERRPFTPREGGERRPYTPRGDRGGFAPREDRGERRGYTPRGDRPFGGNREGGFRPRPDGDRPFNRKPFGDREQGGEERGERRPFTPREGSERRPFAPREGGFGARRPGSFDRKPGGFGDRRPGGFGGPRKPFGEREGGERRPFTPREGGESRPFTPRGDRGGFAPRGGDRESGFAPRRPFTPREGGERRPFTPREGGERRPFTPREGGERPRFDRGDRPSSGDRPRGDRPSFGGGNRPAFGGRPSGGGFGDRKRFSGEPGEGRPSFQSGAHSAGPGGSKFGGSGFGRDRGGKGAPGKFGKPGFKPSFRGPGSGPARGGAPKRRPE